MDKNYYHVSFGMSDSKSVIVPQGGKMINISGANVTRHVFPNGDELLSVIHNGKVDLYASFPIELNNY